MLELGPLSFASGWMLSGLLLLPALWWLLRITPPAPRRQNFPAIQFLLALTDRQQSAARTPWWLLVLRLALAAVLLTALAHPVLNAPPVRTASGPWLLVVDNGWSSAKSWRQGQDAALALLDQAEQAGEPVLLLPTAPGPDGQPPALSKLQSAAQARGALAALAPQPWLADRRAALQALAGLDVKPGHVVWLTDGLASDGDSDLTARLTALGPLEILRPHPARTARILLPPRLGRADLDVTILRASGGMADGVTVIASDTQGRTLARAQTLLPMGQTSADASFTLPTELANRIARLDIEGESSAAATVLLDQSNQRHPVGLVDNQGPSNASPLLDDLYYTQQALSPLAEVRRGTVDTLLRRDLSLIVMPDQGRIDDADATRLSGWVDNGGVLVRLAGPKLARNPDALLPVRLRGGGRTLGGAMSWTSPMSLAPMPESGPFAGLAVPPDLKVRSQVLAEPSLDLNDKTWARLEDGTPLVTAQTKGKGWLVLIHTTVWPDWSDLGMSGLFPAMLERLLDLSRGLTAASPDHPLPPAALLDGFGRLTSPDSMAGGIAESLPGDTDRLILGPRHPPGYYGTDKARRAVNLSPTLPPPHALALPAAASVRDLGDIPQARDLQPPLLVVALVLLLADMLALLLLRLGLRVTVGRKGGTAALLALALLLGLDRTGHAADGLPEAVRSAALETRLAYVKTGDQSLDDISRAGLSGLSAAVVRRSTATLGEPVAVDLEKDSLTMYPLLYWPVSRSQPALSAAAQRRLNDYMRLGGMILIDGRGQTDPQDLRALTDGLDIPALTPLTENHVLTRSFYLLREWPGRQAGATVYVQDGEQAANDNVSPVVIGDGDWAAAWAVDRRGNPMFSVTPGGERQRELALRFGVNLIMYALTGSYKADQVHVNAILERLRQ